MKYARSSYAPVHARIRGVARSYPSDRGWGPGWPDCQKGKLAVVQNLDLGVRLRVREGEFAELTATAFEVVELMGYDIRMSAKQLEQYGLALPEGSSTKCGGTWGFACREIKGTNGAPSWHSWGLAWDINAPCNPMSTRWSCNIPPAVVEFLESTGMGWGGRYKSYYDPMHFEYMLRPEDVATDLATARRALAALKQPAQEQPVQLEETVKPDEIMTMQTALQKLGFTDVEVDGVFGPVTAAALAQAPDRAAELKADLVAARRNVRALDRAMVANRADAAVADEAVERIKAR